MGSKTLFVPTLEPAKRSPGFKMKRMHHRIWCPKVRRFVEVYGAHERALLFRLEGNPGIPIYCEHAPSVDEYIDGKRLRHVFTFAAQHADGTEELIDVVEKRHLVADGVGAMVPERWNDKCAFAHANGFRARFVIAGSAEIKNQTVTENWSQILPYVQSALQRNNQELSVRVEAAVRAREVLTVSDLRHVFPADELAALHETLFLLLHTGRVKIDLSRESINRATRVDPA